jgi:hypothetical protein
MALTTSSLTFFRMSGGMFLGPSTPYHATDWYPGTPAWSTAGTSG